LPVCRIPTIGVIAAGAAGHVESFKAGLAELGLIDGQNVWLKQFVANGELVRLPIFATELVRCGVDLIAVTGAVTALAVQAVTTNIPVVYSVVVDPVSDGLAVSLKKPDGNMTGVTTFDPDLARTHVCGWRWRRRP
jgi:putative ABC transport system substrate-binding protein